MFLNRLLILKKEKWFLFLMLLCPLGVLIGSRYFDERKKTAFIYLEAGHFQNEAEGEISALQVINKNLPTNSSNIIYARYFVSLPARKGNLAGLMLAVVTFKRREGLVLHSMDRPGKRPGRADFSQAFIYSPVSESDITGVAARRGVVVDLTKMNPKIQVRQSRHYYR